MWIYQERQSSNKEDAVLKLTNLHIAAHKDSFWNIRDFKTTWNQVREKDILE
jgi:hypothetical protein